MLTVHSVLMVYLLDSRSYQTLLGGSVRSGALAGHVRQHVMHDRAASCSPEESQMRALITASFDPEYKARLERLHGRRPRGLEAAPVHLLRRRRLREEASPRSAPTC